MCRLHAPYIFHHTLHVSLLSALIGKQCEFSEDRLQALTLSALLHDVGKLRVSLEVLGKQQPLSEDEKEKVRLHSLLGFRFLQKQRDYDLPILMGVLQHHERLDGSGYPRGLKGRNIPDGARALRVVDTFNAMVSPRLYRAPHAPEEALEELTRLAGSELDPELTGLYRKVIGF